MIRTKTAVVRSILISKLPVATLVLLLSVMAFNLSPLAQINPCNFSQAVIQGCTIGQGCQDECATAGGAHTFKYTVQGQLTINTGQSCTLDSACVVFDGKTTPDNPVRLKVKGNGMLTFRNADIVSQGVSALVNRIEVNVNDVPTASGVVEV